jgi:KaiC/GvpD/RAD55 family RecA-like ATPase
MSAQPSWAPLLRTPHPCDHLVQLYTEDSFLFRAVGHFLASGLTHREAAVIIATPAHAEAFRSELQSLGVDVASAVDRGQFTALDADECLAKFMVDGMPDGRRFRALVTPVLDRLRADGFADIRVYGEMVNLLFAENLPATVRLEELWNELLADERVSLLCAYRIDNFDRRAHRGLLHRISRCHSHLIPVDDYDRLDRAVDRAYEDVFGRRGSAADLRRLITASYPSEPVMPSAQAALFALHGLAPSVADAVIERTRDYYMAGPEMAPQTLPTLGRAPAKPWRASAPPSPSH